MQINKLNPKLLLQVFCFVAILCFYQTNEAQSGRHIPNPSPTPSSIQPTATTETTPSEKNEPTEKIEYLLIVGEVQNDDSYSETSQLNRTLDYCLKTLKNQPNLKLKAEVGGKMNFKAAQEAAKKGKNVYILWIGFAMENLGKGKTQVSYANFTILNPEDAKKLFTGRVDSKMLSKNGGVNGTRFPPSNQSISETSQMENVGKEIIYRLLRWGWLSD